MCDRMMETSRMTDGYMVVIGKNIYQIGPLQWNWHDLVKEALQ